MPRIAPLLLALLLAAAPAVAGPSEDRCLEDIAATREMVAMLPSHDLSRRYAENDLNTAAIEMGSGDPDECLILIDHARHIIATRPYALRPGETLGTQSR